MYTGPGRNFAGSFSRHSCRAWRHLVAMVKMATGINAELYWARDARCRRLLNRHERLEGAWRSMQLTERKRSEIGTFLDSIVLRQVEEDTPGPFLVKIQSGRQTGRCFITSHGRGLREIGISARLIAHGSKQCRKVGAKRRNKKRMSGAEPSRLRPEKRCKNVDKKWIFSSWDWYFGLKLGKRNHLGMVFRMKKVIF